MVGYQMQQCGASCRVDYAHALVDWAQMELLKEKVKKRLDEKYGGRLDAMADLIVDVVASRTQASDELDLKEEQLDEAWQDLHSGE